MPELKDELRSLRLPDEELRPRRGRRIAAVVVVLVAALGIVLGWRARTGRADATVEVARPVQLRVEDRPRFAPVLTASGYVVARRKAVVSSKIQGRLSELRVEEGSRVKQGEIIARLENADAEAAVARARAAVTRAEADLAEQQRQYRLASKLWAQEQVVSKDSVDAAASRVTSAAAALEQARADVVYNRSLLDNTIIRAPFSGTVVKKMAEVGESVAPIPPGVNISTASGAIVALADLDTLEVEADVNESNVAQLKPDQHAEVIVEAFPDTKFRAVLRQVIPSADRTKATVQVKVTILDKDARLRPEMSARVTFLEPLAPQPAGAPPPLAVPADAVVQRGGRPVVFIVKGGFARAVPVSTTPGPGGTAIVADGVAPGDEVVARPGDALADGARVTVAPPPQATK